MTLMALMTAISGVGSALTSNQGRQSSTFNKGQRSAIDDILSSIKGMKGSAQDITQNQNYQTGQDWLQSMFNDPEFFKNFEAPAMRQFNEEILPGVANRFASQGSGGSLGSTAFRNQIGRESSNLATNLAAMRGQMQQQAIPQLLGYSQQPFSNYQSLLNTALGKGTQDVYQPPSAGPFGGAFASLLSAFAQSAGNKFGSSMA